MILKELTKNEFDEFSSSHVLKSYFQTSTYGTLMSKYGYSDMYIGAYVNNTLVAASLILTKSISLNVKYGYAPRGFLIDYFDEQLFKEFSKCLRKYFNKKGYAFIKIDPLITYAEVFPLTNTKNVNSLATPLYTLLENNKYKRLKNNIYFESMLPKYNPIVNLKEFTFNSLDEKLQKRLNKINHKGLSLIKGDLYSLNSFYELIRRKESKSPNFYKSLYKIFDETNMVDLYLVKVNYHEYLKNLQEDLITEQAINEKVNKVFKSDINNKEIYREKMRSDRVLNDINIEIADITSKLQNSIYEEIIAGAIIIKYGNVVSIFESGFNKLYNRLLPNHYLHYMLMNHYKEAGYSFFDLNGMTGDFSKDNPYKGLNDFKMLWHPRTYEYLGEFDLIVNQTKYSLLWTTKTLHREFENKEIKTNENVA